MRPSRFTDDQIVQALAEVRAGTPALHMCRTMGITQTTFYRWRKKFDVRGGSDVREMEGLRDENQKLKQIVADLMLDKLR